MSDKTKDGWLRTSMHRPCPICERDWCTVSPDGSLCCCMRAESDWPVKNGGWIHRLTDALAPARADIRPKEHAPAEHPTHPAIDCHALMRSFQADTAPDAIRRHALALGVSSGSLVRLGIAWAAAHKAWAFPMLNENTVIVGIRLRNQMGRKWAVSGSRQGLFWPIGSPEPNASVMICEGPTDTAAMLDLGYFAVGRPSCTGCSDMLQGLTVGYDVVIMGDRDLPKVRPDGTIWHPGQDGARRLADHLCGKARSVRIILPLKGCKDARAWLQAGVTRPIVDTVIRQKPPWRPKQ